MADRVLRVEGLSKSFGALKACDGISLDVREGEIHALIGPNGAGKSTFMKLLAGEETPDFGDVFLAGESLAALNAVQRSRAGLARTFQMSSLIQEFTVQQNLLLALMGASGRAFRFFARASGDAALNEQAADLLQQFGLAQGASLRVSEISHGERRQLEVALALALKPRVLLMDEPMAGMGPDGTRSLTAQLKELKHCAPILLVEHDMDAVFELADRLSVLVYGRIIATGTVEEIRNNDAVRDAYLGREDT